MRISPSRNAVSSSMFSSARSRAISSCIVFPLREGLAQGEECASLQLLDRTDALLHHPRRFLEREPSDHAQGDRFALVVTQLVEVREESALAQGAVRHLLGRRSLTRVGFRLEDDKSWLAGSSAVVVDEASVGDRKSQRTHVVITFSQT